MLGESSLPGKCKIGRYRCRAAAPSRLRGGRLLQPRARTSRPGERRESPSEHVQLLRPGGVFRLVVPDLAWRARNFIEAHECGKPDAADEFMKTTYLDVDSPVSGVVSHCGKRTETARTDGCTTSGS